MTLPSVAIIGAGPSGLAAAKALLEYGFSPVVFDAASQIGGMWQGPGRGAWSDFGRTNLSRYSCAFSDLAWAEGSDVFPIRREIAGYLRRYADRFDLLSHVRFSTRIEHIRPAGDGSWRLDWRDLGGGGGEASFDQVVIGSGFLASPFTPPFPGLTEFGGEVLHSATCDTAAALRARFTGKRVLVVGAAFSGTEIAAELAPYAQVTVTFRRPMWFVPRWVQAAIGEPRYPIDLVIYNRRADNPLLREPHEFLRRVGGDPGAVSPELAFDRDAEPPMAIIISDDFLALVRGGSVAVKRSASLRFDAGGVTYADDTRQALEAVIVCTGFTDSLPFLDLAARETIGFDPLDQLEPELLHRNMFHPDLPGLTFIGHYRGPYFPVMELQSRWIARIFAGELPLPDRAAMLAGIAEERATRALSQRPQFPHGDFVGLADGLAREVGVFPALAADDPLRSRVMEGPVTPAHYRLVGPHAQPELARALIASTPAPRLDDRKRSARPLLGRRVLELLRGAWAIERRIEPGGHFTGTANYTPRCADSLLYRETGTLVLDAGVELNGEMSYVYSLRDGAIEISFAEGLSQGAHFIDIALPDDQSEDLPIVSVDRHLCRLDTYNATVRIETSDLFTITYIVNGPTKAYTIRSTYRRLDGSAADP